MVGLHLVCGAEKTHESLLGCKEIRPVNFVKEISPEYSLEGLMLKLKLQYFGHLIWGTDSLEKTLMLGKIEGSRRRGWQRMRWLVASRLDGHEFEQASGVGDGQQGLACCNPWSHKNLDTPEQLNWTERLTVFINMFLETVLRAHYDP